MHAFIRTCTRTHTHICMLAPSSGVTTPIARNTLAVAANMVSTQALAELAVLMPPVLSLACSDGCNMLTPAMLRPPQLHTALVDYTSVAVTVCVTVTTPSC